MLLEQAFGVTLPELEAVDRALASVPGWSPGRLWEEEDR